MNNESFREIYSRHYKKLYHMAYRFVYDSSTAEDLVQETYLKLWEKYHSDYNIDNPEAYACIVLRNTCLNYIKQRRQGTGEFEYLNINDNGQAIANIDDRNTANYIKELILKLPEPQREIMILRHIKGLSYQEMAQQTGIKETNIRVIISRGRKTIRQLFNKNDDHEI